VASDAADAPTGRAVDDCVGFAEPADVLARLTPDDLHPARLAGPHAWHPWGLTVAPPTDRHLRLLLPAATRPDTIERLLAHLETRLSRAPWPPQGTLEVRRNENRLDCRSDGARRSLVDVDLESYRARCDRSEVVTRDGWPILDELAALNDRVRCIDVDDPARSDLADLSRWVEQKMSEAARAPRLAASLAELLGAQARHDQPAASRLRAILTHHAGPGQHRPGLAFLADQLSRSQAAGARTLSLR
jgi:hypothetical protein